MVRMSLEGKDIDAESAREVVSGSRHFVAVRLPELETPAVVLVAYREDAAYLSGAEAVNGTARSLTNLPEAASSTIPKAGEAVLRCVT